MAHPLSILCPGQGAQNVGMGRAWLEASPESRAVFEEADSILGSKLGAPLSRLCFDGPADTLNRTDTAQPAIFATSIACWRGLLSRWHLTEGDAGLIAAAGLSLGEYTALCIAGALSFEDGLRLVALRGRAMQDAAESRAGGMLALLGADDAHAIAICEAARGPDILVCANFNAPGQVVLSGQKPALDRAAAAATEQGFRSSPLAVAGAFHSPLMAAAAETLGESLERTALREPRCPVLSNATGHPHAPEAGHDIAASIRRNLVAQLTSPVRWADNCRWLSSSIKAECHELAPGPTLSGLMRRTDRSFRVTTHDEPDQNA